MIVYEEKKIRKRKIEIEIEFILLQQGQIRRIKKNDKEKEIDRATARAGVGVQAVWYNIEKHIDMNM